MLALRVESLSLKCQVLVDARFSDTQKDQLRANITIAVKIEGFGDLWSRLKALLAVQLVRTWMKKYHPRY